MESSPVLKRSFSLPPSRSPTTPDPQVEVLYNLPSARIIAFSTSNSLIRPGSNNGSPIVEDIPGTLPWVSRFERTIAVGPLRIYRAPGSVAFLNCANALQPILPKSQSWCVDGDSKFVLQIRRPQYWRIEVPNQNREEKIRVEELKEVLSKVLLFEKTPCPFQRDFTVQLPEAPQTPIKKRPWKPVNNQNASPIMQPNCLENGYGFGSTDSPSALSRPTTPLIGNTTIEEPPKTSQTSPTITEIYVESTNAQPHVEIMHSELGEQSPLLSTSRVPPLDEKLSSAEQSSRDINKSPSTITLAPSLLESSTFTSSQKSESRGDDSDSFSDATDDTNITPKISHFQSKFQPPLDMEPEYRLQALQNCSRFATAPPVLSLITSPPSKHRTKSPLRGSIVPESDSSFSSSVESFHSIQSWHSPLDSPSPQTPGKSSGSLKYPYPHDNIVLPKQSHTRQTSELTTAPSEVQSETSNISPLPATPTLSADVGEKSDEESIEIVTPPPVGSNIRHRATTSSNSRRRELSPLPAAVNLFSPPPIQRSRRMQTARHIPTAIIQTTCKILLSPPSHLLHMMLNIASKIAAGEWRGFLFSGYGEVHWDLEDEYARGEVWAEDDYGITIPGSKSKAKRTSNEGGGSWEVD
ncbi:hypothetical protein G7Y89_g5457 [Cudoniella acicularis]|uniref:Inheritance of peroxisomes protein 1 n=1 Tax=Cudoniella acicularis TaxID=354080 RepID=A0A8H4RNU4_9HELO|nr:hypothetical protein G7Y89_g5457 [Cudoniella acicularis]